MKFVSRCAGIAVLLATCVGCSSQYASNLVGSGGVAIVSTVLSEFFSRLFQQI